MQWLGLSCSMALVAACGGPPVGSHVPRPDPAHVAGVAAAAAAAITVADPDAARARPEQADDREPRPVESTESVPGDVLDRAATGAPQQTRETPCEPPSEAASRLELLPGAIDSNAPAPRRRCARRPAADDAPAPGDRPD